MPTRPFRHARQCRWSSSADSSARPKAQPSRMVRRGRLSQGAWHCLSLLAASSRPAPGNLRPTNGRAPPV
eukprot:3049070-Pyramimonas_sp.AAC.1